MTDITPKTLKGFRDFLPSEARKRQYVINTLKQVFETFGFEPLETPALEYENILLGKYGEEGDKLMYRFEDNGGRRIALRYDQTVPLARVVAQYQQEFPIPFKRYQIQPVWRAENTQRGRFREFLQCDADIVGSPTTISEGEIMLTAAECLRKLGFEKFTVYQNDRRTFANIDPKAIVIIDKLKKIGEEGVIQELVEKKCCKDIEDARALLLKIRSTLPNADLVEMFSYLQVYGYDTQYFKYDPTLARGLDYYTGLIFEIEVEGYSAGSVCGGGRYDKLIGMFSKQALPAVGFAFGFDRLLEAMEQLNLFPDITKVSSTRILVTVFKKDFVYKSAELTSYLRNNGINAEIYDNPDDKLDKQLKYADKKGIMYAAIIGPEELEKNTVTIKNLRVRDQQTVTREDLLKVV